MQIAVVGAGIMGHGIAQVAAMHGHEVALIDVGEEELGRGRAAIDTSLARFVKAGKLDPGADDAVRARLTFTTALAEAVVRAEVVIEAVPEIVERKQAIFEAVVKAAPPEALLATNTSQLSITAIGSALGDDAARLVGVHFFNPPVMMRLVELVRGLATTDETLDRARMFATSLGKEVVVCQKDSPGFITSRAYSAFRLECLRILEEGVASAEDIDKAVKLGFNLPMGPFELSDFNGVDTYYHVVTALEKAYGERFRPTIGLTNMIASGRLGRKSGEGFYRYDENGNRIAP